jgi:hypothetical protein
MQGFQINPLGNHETHTQDYSGRGNVVAQPVAQEGQAQMNMASLAPNSRPAPVTSINAAIASKVAGKKKTQEEEPAEGKMTTAAYESEGFDFDSIFDGETLTEEFKEKVKVVFEAAVNERVNAVAAALTEQANAALVEQVEQISEGLSQKLDDYLNYVIEEWMTENKLALEEGIRMDIAESFLSGLKELFESHYVSVPEGKVDVLESVHQTNESLEKELNEKVEENISLRKAILEHQCGIAFLEATDGLTDVQIEKLGSLVEGLQYDSVEQYVEKLNILKESYFRHVTSTSRETVESLEETTDKRITESTDTMGVYLNAISRQAKKSSL